MIEYIDHLMHTYPGYCMIGLGIGQWLLSSTAESMPDPVPGDSRKYQFVYNWLHKLAGNIDMIKAFKTK